MSGDPAVDRRLRHLEDEVTSVRDGLREVRMLLRVVVVVVVGRAAEAILSGTGLVN